MRVRARSRFSEGDFVLQRDEHPKRVAAPHRAHSAFHARPGPGSTPTDLALSKKSQFLFSVNPGWGTIAGWRIGSDGALAFTGAAAGIPASASGIAARQGADLDLRAG